MEPNRNWPLATVAEKPEFPMVVPSFVGLALFVVEVTLGLNPHRRSGDLGAVPSSTSCCGSSLARASSATCGVTKGSALAGSDQLRSLEEVVRSLRQAMEERA